jgi:hypothetical protein
VRRCPYEADAGIAAGVSQGLTIEGAVRCHVILGTDVDFAILFADAPVRDHPVHARRVPPVIYATL